MKYGDLIRRFIFLMVYSIWFGGFTFYITVVVPIGTEVLDSSVRQGFITQRVTNFLNLISVLACAVMLWEAWSGFSKERRFLRILAIVLTSLIFGSVVGLFVIHPILDSHLNVELMKVRKREVFYQWHRLYLWMSTLQWALAIIYGFLIVRNWSNESTKSKATNPPIDG